MAGAVSGVFSFSGVEHFRTQNMQNVWRESVMFSPGLLKSSIEYEVNTHYTHTSSLSRDPGACVQGSGANALELV